MRAASLAVMLVLPLALVPVRAEAFGIGRIPEGSWNGYVRVPDVVGLSPGDAKRALQQANVCFGCDIRIGRGCPTVISQSESGGTWVKLETTVYITVRKPTL